MKGRQAHSTQAAKLRRSLCLLRQFYCMQPAWLAAQHRSSVQINKPHSMPDLGKAAGLHLSPPALHQRLPAVLASALPAREVLSFAAHAKHGTHGVRCSNSSLTAACRPRPRRSRGHCNSAGSSHARARPAPARPGAYRQPCRPISCQRVWLPHCVGERGVASYELCAPLSLALLGYG